MLNVAMHTSAPILISVVVPVYAGERYLRALMREIAEVKCSWEEKGAPFALAEVLCVDDASVDDSLSVLQELSQEYDWLRVLTLSRNFGQQPATVAGILHSCGDWVVTLDEDLQHPPRLIEPLLKKAVEEQWDVVYVRPTQAVHRSLFRDLSSRLFKKGMAYLTENPQVPLFNSFRLMRGPIARAAASIYRSEGYFDIFLGWFTTSIGAVEAELRDARYQETKSSGYTLRTLLSHARRLVVSSQLKILRIGLALGFVSVAFSFIYGLYVIYAKLSGQLQVPGWASLMVALLFLGGLTLFILGLMLEYFTVLLGHTNGKPPFFMVDRSKDVLVEHYFCDPAHALS